MWFWEPILGCVSLSQSFTFSVSKMTQEIFQEKQA